MPISGRGAPPSNSRQMRIPKLGFVVEEHTNVVCFEPLLFLFDALNYALDTLFQPVLVFAGNLFRSSRGDPTPSCLFFE